MESAANYFRTRAIIKAIKPYIPSGSKVLDIGAGSCHIAKTLAGSNGLSVTAIDLVDHNITDLQLNLYDGKRLPYKDKSFDIGLIIFVLHHAPSSELLLREAKRVCKKLIVIEDTPGNAFERSVWKRLDYALNHAMHDDVAVAHKSMLAAEWQKVFSGNGLKTINCKPFRSLASTGFTYPHTVFVLE